MFIHVNDKHGKLFALLVDAVEIFFIHQSGNRLVRHKCAGCQRADGRQVKLLVIASVRDEETTLVNNQRGRRVRLRIKIAQRLVELLNIFLDELWQRGHLIDVGRRALVEILLEQHPRNHIQRFKHAFAFMR